MVFDLCPINDPHKCAKWGSCRHLIFFGLTINKTQSTQVKNKYNDDHPQLQRTQIFKETSMETTSRRWPKENQQFKGGSSLQEHHSILKKQRLNPFGTNKLKI